MKYKRIFAIAITMLSVLLNTKALATKLPNDVWNFVKANLPQAQQRFDSVITLENDLMYIPLYPPSTTTVENIAVEYTYPAKLSFKNYPEVVLLNNGYSFLKVMKDSNGNYSLTQKDDLPLKVRLGIMPQDMLTPIGLKISMAYYSNISNQNVNGYDNFSQQSYLDRVIAHELTHSAMAANIKYFYNMPAIIVEGMAELTHGIDDTRKGDIQKLAGDSSLLSQALRLSTGYNYVSGVNAPDYAGGYMLLRYLAKQASEDNNNSGGDDTDDNNNNDDDNNNDTVRSSQIFTSGDDTYTNTKSATILSALGGVLSASIISAIRPLDTSI